MNPISKPQDIEPGYFDHILKDDDWVIQQKIDGVRVIVRCNGATGFLTAETKTGLPLAPRELKFWEEIKGQFPRDTDYQFDGELAWGHYYPFDELMLKGHPYRERIARVHELVDRWAQPNIRKIPQATGTQDKLAFWQRVLDQRVEGVVLWNLARPWTHGRHGDVCCRYKQLHRCNVVLMEMNKKRSAKAFVYDQHAEPLHIGSVPLLSRKNFVAVDEQFRRRKLVVAEIEYRHRSHNGIIVEPKLIRFRHDVTPAQCTVDQPFHEAHAGEMDGGPSISAIGSSVGLVGHAPPGQKPQPEDQDSWVERINWPLVVSALVLIICGLFNFMMRLGGSNGASISAGPRRSYTSRGRFGGSDSDDE